MTNEELYSILNDRFEGWELVDLLGLSAEDICFAFPDEITDHLEELKEILDLDEPDEEDEGIENYDDLE